MRVVPLLDLKAQYAAIRTEILEEIDRVYETQHFVMGPVVKRLEKEVSAFCGAVPILSISRRLSAVSHRCSPSGDLLCRAKCLKQWKQERCRAGARLWRSKRRLAGALFRST